MPPCVPPQRPSAYLRILPLPVMMGVLMFLVAFGWIVFSPETFPYHFLGPVGTILRYLVKSHKAYFDTGFAISCVVHVAEALYSVKLCRDKGITDSMTQVWWFIQTVIFVVISLFCLLTYNPPREENTKEGLNQKKN